MTDNQKELAEVIREIQHLIALNGVTPRTENKSLLNYNLDRRKRSLEFTLSILEKYQRGELVEPMSEKECPHCDGTGKRWDGDVHYEFYRCPQCDGTGHVARREDRCPECNGKGYKFVDTNEGLENATAHCYYCNGTGRVGEGGK